jgi:hypothetical protein
MSDSPAFNPAYEQAAQAFGKFVPGFDFLQALVQNAGKALPSVGQWVAPTLDPAELERRIEELRTVQFWLEQNARMLGVTIQALEVQRMTLGTLKGMNVSMTDLSEALKVRVPDFAMPPAPAAPVPAAAAPAPASAPTPAPAADPGTGASPIDPGQWWGALTQQFTQLATQAMQASSQAAQEAAGQAQEVMQASAAAMEGATAAAAAAAASAATPAATPAAAPRKPAARRVADAAPAPAPVAPKPAARRAPARKTAAKRS